MNSAIATVRARSSRVVPAAAISATRVFAIPAQQPAGHQRRRPCAELQAIDRDRIELRVRNPVWRVLIDWMTDVVPEEVILIVRRELGRCLHRSQVVPHVIAVPVGQPHIVAGILVAAVGYRPCTLPSSAAGSAAPCASYRRSRAAYISSSDAWRDVWLFPGTL